METKVWPWDVIIASGIALLLSFQWTESEKTFLNNDFKGKKIWVYIGIFNYNLHKMFSLLFWHYSPRVKIFVPNIYAYLCLS